MLYFTLTLYSNRSLHYCSHRCYVAVPTGYTTYTYSRLSALLSPFYRQNMAC